MYYTANFQKNQDRKTAVPNQQGTAVFPGYL